MRTIKFRGQSTYDKSWVYGDLLHTPANILNEEKASIMVFQGIESGEPIFDELFVIPETVGQELSMKDRFGADVYDGDIIEIFWSTVESTTEVISYDEKYDYWKYGNNALCELRDPDTDFEVIGNIHQHPQLIK